MIALSCMALGFTQYINYAFSPKVRDSDAVWRDTRRQLRRDHRWELASLLDRDEKEKVFNLHTDSLAKKKKDQFKELLDETDGVSYLQRAIIHCNMLGRGEWRRFSIYTLIHWLRRRKINLKSCWMKQMG